MSEEVGAVLLLVGGMLGLVLLCSPILVPLLWITRLVVNIEVTTRGGVPAPGVKIGGIRNREGRALSATGQGHIAAGELFPVSDRLGETDAQGLFQKTYYLRNFHTLLLGDRVVFVTPELKEKMRQGRVQFALGVDPNAPRWS